MPGSRTAAAPLTAPPGARERILATASELFYGRGIRNVGIDEIIAKSGVAKASLYKHFESKDVLILEFLRRRDTAWRASFEAAVAERAEKPRDRLLAVFDVLEDWFDDDNFRGCPFINATIELADSTHPAHRASVEHKRRTRAYLRDLAKAARLKDPETIASQLALLVEGAIVTALLEERSEPARQAKEAAARLLSTR